MTRQQMIILLVSCGSWCSKLVDIHAVRTAKCCFPFHLLPTSGIIACCVSSDHTFLRSLLESIQLKFYHILTTCSLVALARGSESCLSTALCHSAFPQHEQQEEEAHPLDHLIGTHVSTIVINKKKRLC
uniref:Secreted protein n=1 Tax=Ixodes ricinus TaxID=34613 RepID=A0A6B0UQH6_IXORI